MSRNMPKSDTLLSLDEARIPLGDCSLRHVYTLISSGALDAVKSGRRTLIKRSEIDRYISVLPAARRAA